MNKFNIVLLFFGLLFLSLVIYGLITWAITSIIIWGVNGFGYDISDKFWFIFYPIYVILCLVPRGK